MNDVHLRAIYEHASERFPLICFGAITASGTVRFEITDEEIRDHFRLAVRIANLAETPTGFYWSHVGRDGAADEEDLARAHWLGYEYVIVGVTKGRPGDFRFYRLEGTNDGNKYFRKLALSDLWSVRA
jgi:proteasome lid subunit RPN8/RPN11